jgi:hypothetical protein
MPPPCWLLPPPQDFQITAANEGANGGAAACATVLAGAPLPAFLSSSLPAEALQRHRITCRTHAAAFKP